MLIGIDMLGIQSPDPVGRESTRIGFRLVKSLLERHSEHRFVLYGREGWPPDTLPRARNALRIRLPESVRGPSNGRPAIREILDRNPDGLDWLILLDPFQEGDRGQVLEVKPGGLKVASLIANVAPDRLDDRRFAPLRDHDAILVASEEVGDELAERWPTLAGRIMRLGPGIEASWVGPASADPCPELLDDLGIVGPFLFANLAAGASRSNLRNLLEAYCLLPSSLRDDHQLVIAGEVGDPWSAVGLLQERGCAEGLVLVGRVEDRTLRLLHERTAAIVAGRSGSQPAVLAGAGLLADPSDPAEIAAQIARILTDGASNRGLRWQARERARDFPWEPLVDRVLAILAEAVAPGPNPIRPDETGSPWPEGPLDGLDEFEQNLAAHEALLESLARQFETIHVLADVFSVKSKLKRLRRRPGLAYLLDETSLDRIESRGGPLRDIEGEVACQRLLELFLSGSCLAVRSPRAEAAIRSRFPEFADQVALVSPERAAMLARASATNTPDRGGPEGIPAEESREPSFEEMTGLTPLPLHV